MQCFLYHLSKQSLIPCNNLPHCYKLHKNVGRLNTQFDMDKFTKIVKSKSSEYKTLEGYRIIYGTTETKYGKCLMGLKDNQICFVSFVDGIYTDLNELTSIFPKAVLMRNDKLIEETVHQYLDKDEKPSLLLTGTDFQIRVWEYLINLPKGKTTSYEQVAKGINSPKAVRAVANAIASNKIAYFVPCHRIISKNGNLNKYKWGTERKKMLLRAENTAAKKLFIEQLQRNIKAS